MCSVPPAKSRTFCSIHIRACRNASTAGAATFANIQMQKKVTSAQQLPYKRVVASTYNEAILQIFTYKCCQFTCEAAFLFWDTSKKNVELRRIISWPKQVIFKNLFIPWSWGKIQQRNLFVTYIPITRWKFTYKVLSRPCKTPLISLLLFPHFVAYKMMTFM